MKTKSLVTRQTTTAAWMLGTAGGLALLAFGIRDHLPHGENPIPVIIAGGYCFVASAVFLYRELKRLYLESTAKESRNDLLHNGGYIISSEIDEKKDKALFKHPKSDLRVVSKQGKETNIIADWKADWNRYMALREFVQNVRDEQVDGKATTIGVENVNGDLYIWDNGSGAKARDLLYLGESGKRESTSSAGVFGSGSKVACLVLTRDGTQVEIISKNLKITPAIKSDEFGKKVLWFNAEEYSDQLFDGTCYIVRGAGAEAESLKEKFTFLSPKRVVDMYQAPKSPVLYDKVIVEKTPKLYVRGIYFCDLDGRRDIVFEMDRALFSYDLNGARPGGKDLMTGEDRLEPSWYRIAEAVGALLVTMQNKGAIKQLIEWLQKTENKSLEASASVDETATSMLGTYHRPVNRTAWREALKELYGEKILLLTRNDREIDANYVAQNWKAIRVPRGWERFFNAQLGVPTLAEVVAAETKANFHTVSYDSLTDQQRSNFDTVQRAYSEIGINLSPDKIVLPIPQGAQRVIAELPDKVPPELSALFRRISMIFGAEIMVEFFPVAFDSRKKAMEEEEGWALLDRIQIKATTLDSLDNAFDTIGHELVHLLEGYGDNDPRFGVAMSRHYGRLTASLLRRQQNASTAPMQPVEEVELKNGIIEET